MRTALLLSAALLLTGCASTERDAEIPNARCVAGASVRFATIERDTSYAFVRRAAGDVLFLEESRGGTPEHTFTWIIELPADTPIGQPIRFSDSTGEASAWVLESAKGIDTHAIRVGGSVVVHSRTDDGVSATVVLNGVTDPAKPGGGGPTMVSVTRKALWVYDEPFTPTTRELETDEG